MKKLIVIGVLLAFTNALAVCENERAERDKFRDLCLGFGGASVGIATGGALIFPVFGGLLGLIPGAIAQNQCRIWKEKEHNLEQCEAAHAQAQRDELARQQRILREAQQRQNFINAINNSYDNQENTARENHRISVRNYMQGLIQQGRDLRDPLVQAELRQEVQRLEGELNAELLRLAQARQREIAAVG